MSYRRKHRSASVERDACLHIMGLLGQSIQWNHNPPLELREKVYDAAGRHIGYEPDENDPRFIEPLPTAQHAAVTNGKPHDKSGGDKHKIYKARRLARSDTEYRQRMAAKLLAPEPVETERQKRKAKIPSRPFPKPPKSKERKKPCRTKIKSARASRN